MPENLSLKMINEGLVVPCPPVRSLQGNTVQGVCKRHFIHLQPPVCPHTHTHSSTLTCAPPQKLSVPCRWNKSFSEGMLLSWAAQTPWNAFQPFHQRESSPLWISVACGGKMPCQTAQAEQGTFTLLAILTSSLLPQTLHRCLASQN